MIYKRYILPLVPVNGSIKVHGLIKPEWVERCLAQGVKESTSLVLMLWCVMYCPNCPGDQLVQL